MSAISDKKLKNIYEYKRILNDGSTSVHYGYSFMIKGIKFQKVTFKSKEEAYQAYQQRAKEIKSLLNSGKEILPEPSQKSLVEKKLSKILKEKKWIILSEYKNNKHELMFQCMSCSNIFKFLFNNIKKKTECPKCKKLRFEVDAKSKLNQLGFELISEYKSIRQLAEIKCLKCGKSFKRTLKRQWKQPTCVCGRNFDWSQINLNKLKSDYLNGNLSIEKLSKKYGIGHNTLREKIKELQLERAQLPKPRGPGHFRYKGVYDKGLTLYKTYAERLSQLGEEVRQDPDNIELLNVKCYYSGCKKWFRPKWTTVVSRIAALEGRTKWGQNSLYCSAACKEKCSLYGKTPFKCQICGKWFVGEGRIIFCENCSPARRTFSPSIKKAIYKRDLKFGWVKIGNEYEIHHILNVSEFSDYAKQKWNGWAIDNTSKLHSKIHNICGLAKRDFFCIDEKYFEIAINKLKENDAPLEVIEFCIKMYENR